MALSVATLWGSSRGSAAWAQPNLPPPPPPPLGEPTDSPPPAEAPSPAVPPSRSSAPAARRGAGPTAPLPSPPRVRVLRRRAPEVITTEEAQTRPVALTLNPLALVLGRLSGNVEILAAPHHSFVVSPNVLVAEEGRGDRYNLASEGLGFATRPSSSVGLEVGYHYWWWWGQSLRGPFLGPSLLVGSTTNASVGDPSHVQAYWGAAFDGGGQEVLPGGFTIGGAIGLAVIKMADAFAVFPRLLFQVGWCF